MSDAFVRDKAASPQQPDGSGTLDPLRRIAQLSAGVAATPSQIRVGGAVNAIWPHHVRVAGLRQVAKVGMTIEVEAGSEREFGQIVELGTDGAVIKLFSSGLQIGLGASAWIQDDLSLRPDRSWCGRIINPVGVSIDGLSPLVDGSKAYAIDGPPIPPLSLDRVSEPIRTGVKAIDLFTPICAGQRIGIFAGSGVGKSTLVSMITRSQRFAVIVVALVAERSREVREFIEDVIGDQRHRSIVVVSPSSDNAMMRTLAAKSATTIAEYFRDCGDDVLLVVDSITRYAHALREVAVGAGEAPVARGYAPSVFTQLPKLLERAGPGTPTTGSITGIYSVLVDGEDHNEPVADTVRGVLDGHIVLDRAIADQGRYPAINLLTSLSRLAPLAWTPEQATIVRRLRALVARYEETRDLRAIGAYRPGHDVELDQAVLLAPLILKLCTQMAHDPICVDVFAELSAVLSSTRQVKDAKPDKNGASGRVANGDSHGSART